MARIIRGLGDVRIPGASVGRAEYQVEVAEGAHGIKLQGRLFNAAFNLGDLITINEVTVHPQAPKTVLRIQAQSHEGGSRSIAIDAWPLDPGLYPSEIT